jgi:signal transduction histidine kinase
MGRLGNADETDVWGAFTVPGSTETAVNSVFQRYAVWVRVLGTLPCVVVGLLTAPSAHWPVAVAVAALSIVWCGLGMWWLRSTPPTYWRVTAALVGVLVIGLTQRWTEPTAYTGWAFAVASIVAITIQYEVPTRPIAATVVSVTSMAAWVVGGAMTRPLAEVTALGVRMLIEMTLARVVYVLIRSRARAADRAAERLAEERRQAAVASARRAAEREYLAKLHDTASATLLMVSLGVGDRPGSWLAARARQDLHSLAEIPDDGTGEIDLAAVLAQAGDDPVVRVELQVRGPLLLPAAPALVIAHGVREGVANVARHAGVQEATLRAFRDGAGWLTVELTDRGKGFRPDQVSEHRRGLSGSIVERMAAVGGEAEIRSAPGQGTTVSWRWHG